MEHNKRKLRVDLLAAEHNSARVRAFSVGSRAKVPRSDLYRGGTPQTAPLSTILNKDVATNLSNMNNNNNNILSTSAGSSSSRVPAHYSSKSSSVPLLINKGHGSIDPMDDLMEMDFSSKEDEPSPPTATIRGSHLSSTPIRASQPVSVPTAKKIDEHSLSSCGGRVEVPSGYVHMKPTMSASSFPPVQTEYGYMEMRPVGTFTSTASKPHQMARSSSNNVPSSSAKLTLTSSPKTIPIGITTSRNNNYMDMSPRAMPMHVDQPTLSAFPLQGSSDDYLNMSPSMSHTAGSDDKGMDIDLPKTLSAPEGYMEMFWGKKSSSGQMVGNKSSNSTNNNNNNTIELAEKPASDEYINMSFNRKSSEEAAMNKKEASVRLSSMPININLNKYSLNNRKNMIANLTLVSTTATLEPLSKTTRPRCDSKDSGIVTPSGSHTSIFPFSPASPGSKPFTSQNPLDENTLPRKCLVDATTGTLRLSEEEDSNSQTSTPDTSKILNTDDEIQKMDTTPPVDVLSNDYADMTLGSRHRPPKLNIKNPNIVSQNVHSDAAASDYMNCSASMASLSKPVTRKYSVPSNDSAGEYTLMNPCLIRTISAPTTDVTAATKKSILITTNNTTSATKSNWIGFKPITSNTDEMLMSSTSSVKPDLLATTFNRQLSERRCPTAVDTGYELLQMNAEPTSAATVLSNSILSGRLLSRPSSVNSEKIAKASVASLSLIRPNSANSDRLQTISASSSSSTLNSSSSSSTLCGSNCQSPLSAILSAGRNSEDSNSSMASIPPVRPSSVSSERELHYASLDLPSSTGSSRLEVNISAASAQSPMTTRTGSTSNSNSLSGDSSSSPSPSAGSAETQIEQPTFTYAQIDFIKSEKLNKMAAAAAAAAATAASTNSTTTTTSSQSNQRSC